MLANAVFHAAILAFACFSWLATATAQLPRGAAAAEPRRDRGAQMHLPWLTALGELSCPIGQNPDCPAFDVTHNPPAARYTQDVLDDFVGKTLRFNFGPSKVTTEWAEPISELEEVMTQPYYDGRFSSIPYGDIALPFEFDILGSKISAVYPNRFLGVVGFEELDDDDDVNWESFWQFRQLAALAQPSSGDLYVAVDEAAGHVALLFYEVWGAGVDTSTFTVLISSENFIQVTYHEINLYAERATVGVSLGEQPQAASGWEEIETIDDWSCSSNSTCVECPPGTASTEEGTEQCQPCPGNGCNGHGECNPETAVCECTEPYTGDGCTEMLCPVGQGPDCPAFDITHNPPAARYTQDVLDDFVGKTLRFNFGPSKVTTEWAEPISELEEVINPGADARFETVFSDVGVALPFLFDALGRKVSTVYPNLEQGTIGFEEIGTTGELDWEDFWQFRQLAAVGQYYYHVGTVNTAKDEAAGHVVIAFRNMYNGYSSDGYSDFTVLISSENFIQVTYHQLGINPYGAIVGVSLSEQPQSGWEEIQTIDDWSCSSNSICMDCPPGTASTEIGNEACQACPGNGCNGHGECNPETAVCECTGSFTGDGCTELPCPVGQGADCPAFDVTHNPPAAGYTQDTFDLVGKTLRFNFGFSKVTTDWAEPISALEGIMKPDEDLRFEEVMIDDQPLVLPFQFGLAGVKISTVYPRGSDGSVGFEALPFGTDDLWGDDFNDDDDVAGWDEFWRGRQLAALAQTYRSYSTYVAMDEAAGHVVIAFRDMYNDWGEISAFTMLLSNESFAQVTYHQVHIDNGGAIVGVSLGEQPQAASGWEEIETIDDWSCSSDLTCADCPPGTASTEEGTEQCQPCPGYGCNGHGECNPETAVCECAEPYFGEGCTEVEQLVCPIAQAPNCPAFDVTHNPPAAGYTQDAFDLVGKTLRFNFGFSKVTTDFAEPISELEALDAPTQDPRFESVGFGSSYYYSDALETLRLPFEFNILGSKVSAVYLAEQQGAVYLGEPKSSGGDFWDEFWNVRQLAGLVQPYGAGNMHVAVDETAGHVVIAFRGLLNDAGASDFTVLISSENFIQVTYHEVHISAFPEAIVGVSLGSQPQAGWEEIQTIDDWSCLGSAICMACPAGTASVQEGTEQCEPCPGNGCNGHGKCNPATAVCECTGLYTGDACQERQNVAASMAFGFVTLVLVLAFGVPCICFGKAHSMTKSVSERAMHPFLWKVVVNMDVARHFKNMVAQKQALAFLHDEQKMRKARSANRLARLFAAIRQLAKVLAVLGVAFFLIYMTTFLQMIGNVFLLARGLFSTNVSQLEDRMSEIYDTLREFFMEADFEWLADFLIGILKALGNIDFRVIAIGGMDVTCEGSQAPGLLFVNLLVAAGVVLLISLSIFPFLKITLRALVGTFGDMLAIRRMMGQNASRMIIVALSAMLTGLEGLFKYGVQMGASLMEFEAFFPRHPSNDFCDEDSANMDTTLAMLSTILAFVFFPPIIHMLLVTFVPGIPKGVEFPSWEDYKAERQKQDGRPSFYGRIKRTAESVGKRARSMLESKGLSAEAALPDKPSTKLIERFKPADPDLDSAWVLNHETFAQTKAEREVAMNFEPVPNVPNSNVLLKLIYHEMVYKCFSTKTLRLYIYSMAWKVWKLLQITFGYWDDEAIRAFHIRELAEKFDDDVGDDNNHHTTIISLVGVSHPLMWQLFSGAIVLSKLAEAINEDGHAPFIVAKNSGITVQSMWSANEVKLAPGGAQEEIEELPSGRIAAVVAVRPTKMRKQKQNGIVVVIRGYCTSFEEDVEKQGMLLLGCSPSADLHDEHGLLKVQVDEIINDVCLRGTMAEDDFRKLPRSLVHRLQDYEIDQSCLKGFIAEKKTVCAVCYSIWNCCTRCCCCCCCCCCCKSDEEAAVTANRMDRDGQQPNSFAAKIEKLGDENRALPYKIKNKTKHALVRFVQWGRGLFAGRLYKCLVRVSRFGTELGFVLMPSMLWLQLFFVVSLPSILINTIRTLNSCGIEFDELKELLTDPFGFLCGNLGDLLSGAGGGVQAGDMDRLSGMIEMMSDPVSRVAAVFGDDLPELPEGVSDIVDAAIEESEVVEQLQDEALAHAEAAKSQLEEAISGADKEAEVKLPEEAECVAGAEDSSSSAGGTGLLPGDAHDNVERLKEVVEDAKDAAEALHEAEGSVSQMQATARGDEEDADGESQLAEQHEQESSGDEKQQDSDDSSSP